MYYFALITVGFMESIIGIDHINIFTAYAGFIGGLSFELSIIKNFDIDDIINLFNKIQSAATNLMSNINNAIQSFKDAINAIGACNPQCIFNKLQAVIAKLPEAGDMFLEVVDSMGDYVGPNSTKSIASPRLNSLVKGVYGLVTTAENDIRRMYTLVFDTVTITLPELGKNVTDTAELIVDAIQALPTCPVSAAFALLTAKSQIESAIGQVIVLWGQFQTAFFLDTGELPAWLKPTDEVKTIVTELVLYLEYHFEVLGWYCNATNQINKQACAVNRTIYDQELEASLMLRKIKLFGDIFAFIQDTILPPIALVQNLYDQITTTWDQMKAV